MKVISLFLIFTIFIWSKRIFWSLGFRRNNPALKPRPFEPLGQTPRISVIVPARNEEKNIDNCLRHLIDQDYPNIEIIVVNDRSTDLTGTLIDNLARQTKVPIIQISVRGLPPGWTGKNHAMFVGSEAASGQWLLFTDADTTHKSWSVSSAIACALEREIDFLTLAPEVESKSFWEKTVQPLAVGSLALWFDATHVNDSDAKHVLANGQFILVNKNLYNKIGSNAAIKNEVVEDVELARRFKTAGYAVRFLNGTEFYSTRMYSTLREIKTGWTRIFVYLFNKKPLPIIARILSFVFFSLLPYLLLLAEGMLAVFKHPGFNPAVFYLSLAACLWIFTIRFFGNKLVKTNSWYAALHPVGSIIMIWILGACLGRIFLNRPSVWRGDSYQ